MRKSPDKKGSNQNATGLYEQDLGYTKQVFGLYEARPGLYEARLGCPSLTVCIIFTQSKKSLIDFFDCVNIIHTVRLGKPSLGYTAVGLASTIVEACLV